MMNLNNMVFIAGLMLTSLLATTWAGNGVNASWHMADRAEAEDGFSLITYDSSAHIELEDNDRLGRRANAAGPAMADKQPKTSTRVSHPEFGPAYIAELQISSQNAGMIDVHLGKDPFQLDPYQGGKRREDKIRVLGEKSSTHSKLAKDSLQLQAPGSELLQRSAH